MNRRCLILSPEAPYPIRTGGAMRTAALLHYLAAHYTVDAIFFAPEGTSDPAGALPGGLIERHLTVTLPAHSRDVFSRASRNLGRWIRGVPPLNDRFGGQQDPMRRWAGASTWDLIVIEHSWCAAYAETLKPHAPRIMLDLHNVESELHALCAQTEPVPTRWLHRRFARRAREIEARWLPEFHLVLATSAHDAAAARRIAPAARAAEYPNTIPVRPVPRTPKRNAIAFSGNLEYHPNRTGVAWFARHVWPALARRHPDLEWVLIGKNPGAVRDLVAGDSRIRLTGEIEDAHAELAQARVAVVPLLSGSGTRVKILEAWQCALPVVSTTIGAEGLPAGPILTADDPAAFAEAVTRLLESAELRQSLGSAGQQVVNRKFTWQAGWNILEALGV